MILTGGSMVAGSSGSGGATTLIQDVFQDTNATNLTSHTVSPTNTPGGSWVQAHGPGFQVQHNNALGINTTGTENIDVIQTNKTDMTVSVIVGITSQTNSSGGPMARCDTSGNGFLVELNGGGNSLVSIYEVSGNGTVFTLRASSGSGTSNNETHLVTLKASGTLLTAYIDGVSKLTYTSSNLATNTYAGIHASVQSSVPATLANFQVTTP